MEVAYLDLNRREYELTKHVSLLQADPAALLGAPDHRAVHPRGARGAVRLRRPRPLLPEDPLGGAERPVRGRAVRGCQLPSHAHAEQHPHVARLAGDQGYARQGADDGRFRDQFGSTQAVVASSGQADAGLFEVNLRDERYLPFEGVGAVSTWLLELPGSTDARQPDPSQTVRQFDYDTIADVVLHVRYTAREGGDALCAGAVANLKDRIGDGATAGSTRLFSVRHEFPTAWAAFKRATGPRRRRPAPR